MLASKCSAFILIVLVFQYCSAEHESCEKHKPSKRKLYNSPNVPPALGPYSHAVEYDGKYVYLSMIRGIEPKTNKTPSDFVEEAEQALKNAMTIIKELGGSDESVVRLTNYLVDINDKSGMNKAYEKVFKGKYPARSVFQVAGLPQGSRYFVDLLAVVDKPKKKKIS